MHGAEHEQVQSIVEQFVRRVADTNGLNLRMATTSAAHPAITFDVNPNADIADDAGYRITVDNGGILVSARTPRGAFYGSVTLWQLLTPPGWTRGVPVQVANGVIDDHPRFAWRALLLDSGRHYQSVADIKKLIDWMSLNKLNVLLWHVTEDQGGRVKEENRQSGRGNGFDACIVGFQPSSLETERQDRQNDPDDAECARLAGRHGAGYEDHGQDQTAGNPAGNFAQQERIQSDKCQK